MHFIILATVLRQKHTFLSMFVFHRLEWVSNGKLFAIDESQTFYRLDALLPFLLPNQYTPSHTISDNMVLSHTLMINTIQDTTRIIKCTYKQHYYGTKWN